MANNQQSSRAPVAFRIRFVLYLPLGIVSLRTFGVDIMAHFANHRYKDSEEHPKPGYLVQL